MYSWFIGRRYLMGVTGRLNTRTLVAILGVTLMVAQWIVMVSIQTGFIDSFRDHVLGASSHITVSKYGVYFSEHRDLRRRVEEDPDVVAASPFMLLQMQISGNDRRSRPGVYVRGVDVDSSRLVYPIDQMLREGEYESLRYTPKEEVALGELDPDRELTPEEIDALFEDPTEEVLSTVALGSVLARQIRVEVGDIVRLNSPLSGIRDLNVKDAMPQGPSVALFKVSAIIETGFLDYDSKLALVDYRALQDWYGRGDVVTGLEVRTRDAFDATAVGGRLQEKLGSSRYLVMAWPEMHQNLFATLNMQKLVFMLVATSGMVVSSFLVLSVLVMIVLEKRKDIGVLMSIGATRRGIRRVFVLQGLAIGVIGSALGLFAGWLVCLGIRQIRIDLAMDVYRIDHLPVGMNPLDFVIGAVAGISLCVLATLYPALRASAVDPLEAIRSK